MRCLSLFFFFPLFSLLLSCGDRGDPSQPLTGVGKSPSFARGVSFPEDREPPTLYSSLPYGARTTAWIVFTEVPPAWVSTNSVTFAFQEEPPLTPPPLFLCSLDSLPYEPCASPWELLDLEDGSHEVSILALEEKGFYLTPANYTWSVDTLPPVLTLTGPSGEITSPEVTFTFSLDEPGTVYCALDGGEFFPCASPLMYHLPFGSHSFQAYGVDRAGNASLVLTLYFKISAHLFFRYKPHARHSSYHLGVSWEIMEPEETLGYECSLNGAPYTSCSPPVVWQHLPQGSYRFEVRARMQAGGYSDPITAVFDTVDCDSPGQMCVIAGVDTAEMVSQPVGEIPGTLYPIGEARGIALDGEGNLYVTDLHGNRIVKRTPEGNLSILAGTGQCDVISEGTPATEATLCWPSGMDLRGNSLYFGELLSRCIRRLDLNTLKIYTVAGQCYSSGYRDGTTSTALFAYPYELRLHPYRNLLFVADLLNNRVRAVDLEAGQVYTVAGNGSYGFCGDGGPAINACFRYVYSVVPDPTGTKLWIGDGFNYRVREMDLISGRITTIVGNGTRLFQDGASGTSTGVCIPTGMEWDPFRSLLWIGTGPCGILVSYDPSSQLVHLEFGVPGGYFGDYGNYGDFMEHSMVRLPPWSNALRYDPLGKGIYEGFSRTLRYFIPGQTSLPVIGTSNDQYELQEPMPGTLAPIGFPVALTGSLSTTLFFSDYIRGKVHKLENGLLSLWAEITSPLGIAWDQERGKVYVSSVVDSVIYSFDEDTGARELLAGTLGAYGYGGDGGPATQAVFNGLAGIFLIPSRDELYIADANNNCVRVIDLSATPPSIRTAAGVCAAPPGYQDGMTLMTRFAGPNRLVGNKDELYIAELFSGSAPYDNFTIRKLFLSGTNAGNVTTVAGVPGIPGNCYAGGPALSTPLWPSSLALDPQGRLVIGNYTRVLLLDESTGSLSFLGPSPNIDCAHPSFYGSGHSFQEGWLGEIVFGSLVDVDGSLLLATYQSAKLVRIAWPW